jgi:hypothetical protein
MRKKIDQVKQERMADEEFRREYDELEEEFSIAGQPVHRSRSEGEPYTGTGGLEKSVG